MIVERVEAEAGLLVAKIEEADRKAEIARLECLAAQERWRREEDRRRVAQSVKDAKEHLGQIIEQWANVTGVEHFLAGVEERAAGLPDDERAHVMVRLELAREFLGSQDPMDFFQAWRTPEERYIPAFPENASART